MLDAVPARFTDEPTTVSRRPTAVADGSEVFGLDGDMLPRAVALRDWLLVEGAQNPSQGQSIAAFAEHLNGLGIPVDRMSTAIEALHAEYSGVGWFWTKGEGASYRLFPHGSRTDEIYLGSPFAEAHRLGEWLLLDLATTPDDAFGIIPEMKAAGYRYYLCIPIVFTSGDHNGISLATSAPQGFSRRDLALLRFVTPTFAAVMEMRSIRQRLDNVLRIYVGDEPHRAILSGAIRRGQVSRIRSAILFADMRDYTRISSELTPEAAVELLNGYFDCLVPAIEEQGGEVLKYMGDGLLAIFRDVGDDTGRAAQAALTAAKDALRRIERANREGVFSSPVAAGIALHHGEAAYGNVGSGARLDFTVIGRDVNLASRITALNKLLGEPLLLSRAFVDHLWGDPEPLGSHTVQGFSEPITVYRAPGGRKAA
jgi:adenylate cyclase